MILDRTVTRFKNGEVIEVYQREVEWEEVRELRDTILLQSDWRAVKDRVLPNEWKEYRTALRDLPQNHATANDAADNWPVMPDE